jgi:hypothetical protein
MKKERREEVFAAASINNSTLNNKKISSKKYPVLWLLNVLELKKLGVLDYLCICEYNKKVWYWVQSMITPRDSRGE